MAKKRNSSPILHRPLEGRVMSNIVLPNGKVYPPSEFLFVASVLKELKAYKVRRFQVVQNKVDEIDINLVIDDDLRNTGVSFKELADKIKTRYVLETGPGVKISVNEVKSIGDDLDHGKPAPLVVSNLNVNEACKLRDK